MRYNFNKLKSIVEKAFANDEVLEEYEMQERLEKTLGDGFRVFYNDSYIDDGCSDSGEDEYVMAVSYTISDKNTHEFYVTIYYGDISHKIGWVRAWE